MMDSENIDVSSELIKLLELLEIEKEEDYRQYQVNFLLSSMEERKKNGMTWYPIKLNTVEPGVGESLIIEIERTSLTGQPHQFLPGKTAEIFSNNEEYKGASVSGVIKYVKSNRLQINISADELPYWSKEGKLGINLTFDEISYREMEIALRRVLDADNNRIAHIRDVLYGKKAPAFKKRNEKLFNEKLNDSQNEALRLIDSALDAAIVHGPPGTGKTTTLVQAIKHTLKTENKILVCSPSNTAVDLLTEKLAAEGVNVLRLGNPARISEILLQNTLDLRVLNHSLYKDIKKYRKKAVELKNIALKYKRHYGKSERMQREALFSEAKSLSKEANAIEDHIIDEQFSKAQVIACTPVGSSSRLMRNRYFDTVFMDEAGQALEAICWIPILKADRVIFAGDHFQLPPTVKSKKALELGFGKSLFEKCIERQNISVMLKIQYRMNSNIMSFSNKKFYGGNLEAHSSVTNRVLLDSSDDVFLSSPLEYIDTAGCSFDEEVNPETLSYYNPQEAMLLYKHLGELLLRYQQVKDTPLSIGIISPYREQVQHLTELLSESELPEKSIPCISIKTIDGFQGQERDIIYISLVRSNSAMDIGFLSDIRRMNVALTRAKMKLVVIGDSATLANHPFYNDYIEYAQEKNAYKSAWEFLV
jgi:ATP-dependent RNA/DNA helicase IGHMBP2